MPAPRSCPHCRVAQNIDSGLNFSDNLGLTCHSCGKVLFPTTLKDENEIDESIRARNAATTNYGGAYGGWNRNQANPPYEHASRTSYAASGQNYANEHRPGTLHTPHTESEEM